jgi:hypothetical protein
MKQQYMTNTHRLEKIKKSALERYDEELEGLNSLSKFCKQRGAKIRHKEQELVQSISETQQRSRSIRNHPKEKR